ncbi:MAG: hypothetical protein FWD52_06345 [Candidatus Bathyarchaeota archaeon]|nr:hypothetical protein [Candidatus Termiticorpusculum sp.]
MATHPVIVIPLLFFGTITIAILATTNTSKKTQKPQKNTYNNKPTYQQHYTPQFSPRMEIDLRLPYRRYKQIYPNNHITYNEYKKIQTQSAYKRSISSQKNHRMVR